MVAFNGSRGRWGKPTWDSGAYHVTADSELTPQNPKSQEISVKCPHFTKSGGSPGLRIQKPGPNFIRRLGHFHGRTTVPQCFIRSKGNFVTAFETDIFRNFLVISCGPPYGTFLAPSRGRLQFGHKSVIFFLGRGLRFNASAVLLLTHRVTSGRKGCKTDNVSVQKKSCL